MAHSIAAYHGAQPRTTAYSACAVAGAYSDTLRQLVEHLLAPDPRARWTAHQAVDFLAEACRYANTAEPLTIAPLLWQARPGPARPATKPGLVHSPRR